MRANERVWWMAVVAFAVGLVGVVSARLFGSGWDVALTVGMADTAAAVYVMAGIAVSRP